MYPADQLEKLEIKDCETPEVIYNRWMSKYDPEVQDVEAVYDLLDLIEKLKKADPKNLRFLQDLERRKQHDRFSKSH